MIETGFIEWTIIDEWKELMKMLPIQRDTSLLLCAYEKHEIWARCLQRYAYKKRKERLHVIINDKQFTKEQKRERESRGEFPPILQWCGEWKRGEIRTAESFFCFDDVFMFVFVCVCFEN